MKLEKGSATVAVALFGVPPNSWCSRFDSRVGMSVRDAWWVAPSRAACSQFTPVLWRCPI